MSLTHQSFTKVRSASHGHCKRYEVYVLRPSEDAPDSDPYMWTGAWFSSWHTAIKYANQLAVAADVRIPVKRPRYTVATAPNRVASTISRIQSELDRMP